MDPEQGGMSRYMKVCEKWTGREEDAKDREMWRRVVDTNGHGSK